MLKVVVYLLPLAFGYSNKIYFEAAAFGEPTKYFTLNVVLCLGEILLDTNNHLHVVVFLTVLTKPVFRVNLRFRIVDVITNA